MDPGFQGWGGTNFKAGDANLVFSPRFPEDCMKVKKWTNKGAIDPQDSPLDPPLHTYKYFEHLVCLPGQVETSCTLEYHNAPECVSLLTNKG